MSQADSDDKARKRPLIDDAMINRGLKSSGWRAACDFVEDRNAMKNILEAALDRRVGPKDRRKEWDDATACEERRWRDGTGRRNTDPPFASVPKKSDRLKREAEARKADPEIRVCSKCGAQEGAGLGPLKDVQRFFRRGLDVFSEDTRKRDRRGRARRVHDHTTSHPWGCRRVRQRRSTDPK